jgi:hypothetical protein
MAVTFTSNGYDTTTTSPYTEIAWANAHPAIGASAYGVRSSTDWAVTAVAGADRTVSIAAGFGWGHGVTDSTVANETIQLDTVSSGSRWDLIVARRDWTPTAGVTSFVKVNGGSTQTIPGGRLVGPGNIDDQPLALVQVTAGQTQPTAIIDLRCWASNGGAVAKDVLAKSYLDIVGASVYIGGMVWRYIPGANDVPEWVASGEVTTYAPIAVTGYSITGDISVEQVGAKKRVTVDLNVTRTGAGIVIGTSFSGFGPVLPTAVRGSSDPKYLPISMSGGTGDVNKHATIYLYPVSGAMSIRSQADFTMPTNALFSVNCVYYI